ncbi:hypothetical protein [Streptomyces sp. NPDC047990]|uniref:hypothetical protein n=1 Tax=Streptomyces sp. NPDC047990 TaxID=3365496 RepID=UPI003710E818
MGQDLDDLLAEPRSCEYAEESTRWICAASGDRDILEPLTVCAVLTRGLSAA